MRSANEKPGVDVSATDAPSDSAADEQILKIRDLKVHFPMRHGTVKAVDGLDLDLAQGETLGLVGESGCGKSVTAQAILRVIPKPGAIVGGSIEWRMSANSGRTADRGHFVDIASLSDKDALLDTIRREEISMIFQEPMTSLSPVHTIGNQIMEACLLARRMTKREARERAIELLDQVGIPRPEQRIDRYTFELSGGMRQRAMIAMALASDPKLLIADEPTTAIDVTIQAQIMELLRRLQSETGMALIIITHDLGVVASMADRMEVMYRGRVVERARCTELFDNPKHPYTQGLLASVPDLTVPGKSEIQTIRGTVPNPVAIVPGCQFHPRCRHFMKGVCDVRFPGESYFGESHTARCHLYSEGVTNESENA